jgi:hypothetical protein
MSSRLKALAGEPIVVFLLAGAALFLFEAWRGAPDEGYRIDVGAAETARLVALWETQTGALPTDEELSNLTEAWIREEIYYREAVRLGLDRDDTIVRRRLIQKLGFLNEAESAVEPAEGELRAFFEREREAYRFPDRYSFEHVYLDPERHEDPDAVAGDLLEQLEAGAAWRSLGDPFMLNSSYAERSLPEVRALLGGSFASALPDRLVGEWSGPVPSAYGVHLVRVLGIESAGTPSFEQVHDRVEVDYLETHTGDEAEAYYRTLRDKYEVRFPRREGGR